MPPWHDFCFLTYCLGCWRELLLRLAFSFHPIIAFMQQEGDIIGGLGVVPNHRWYYPNYIFAVLVSYYYITIYHKLSAYNTHLLFHGITHIYYFIIFMGKYFGNKILCRGLTRLQSRCTSYCIHIWLGNNPLLSSWGYWQNTVSLWFRTSVPVFFLVIFQD